MSVYQEELCNQGKTTSIMAGLDEEDDDEDEDGRFIISLDGNESDIDMMDEYDGNIVDRGMVSRSLDTPKVSTPEPVYNSISTDVQSQRTTMILPITTASNDEPMDLTTTSHHKQQDHPTQTSDNDLSVQFWKSYYQSLTPVSSVTVNLPDEIQRNSVREIPGQPHSIASEQRSNLITPNYRVSKWVDAKSSVNSHAGQIDTMDLKSNYFDARESKTADIADNQKTFETIDLDSETEGQWSEAVFLSTNDGTSDGTISNFPTTATAPRLAGPFPKASITNHTAGNSVSFESAVTTSHEASRSEPVIQASSDKSDENHTKEACSCIMCYKGRGIADQQSQIKDKNKNPHKRRRKRTKFMDHPDKIIVVPASRKSSIPSTTLNDQVLTQQQATVQQTIINNHHLQHPQYSATINSLIKEYTTPVSHGMPANTVIPNSAVASQSKFCIIYPPSATGPVQVSISSTQNGSSSGKSSSAFVPIPQSVSNSKVPSSFSQSHPVISPVIIQSGTNKVFLKPVKACPTAIRDVRIIKLNDNSNRLISQHAPQTVQRSPGADATVLPHIMDRISTVASPTTSTGPVVSVNSDVKSLLQSKLGSKLHSLDVKSLLQSKLGSKHPSPSTVKSSQITPFTSSSENHPTTPVTQSSPSQASKSLLSCVTNVSTSKSSPSIASSQITSQQLLLINSLKNAEKLDMSVPGQVLVYLKQPSAVKSQTCVSSQVQSPVSPVLTITQPLLLHSTSVLSTTATSNLKTSQETVVTSPGKTFVSNMSTIKETEVTNTLLRLINAHLTKQPGVLNPEKEGLISLSRLNSETSLSSRSVTASTASTSNFLLPPPTYSEAVHSLQKSSVNHERAQMMSANLHLHQHSQLENCVQQNSAHENFRKSDSFIKEVRSVDRLMLADLRNRRQQGVQSYQQPRSSLPGSILPVHSLDKGNSQRSHHDSVHSVHDACNQTPLSSLSKKPTLKRPRTPSSSVVEGTKGIKLRIKFNDEMRKKSKKKALQQSQQSKEKLNRNKNVQSDVIPSETSVAQDLNSTSTQESSSVLDGTTKENLQISGRVETAEEMFQRFEEQAQQEVFKAQLGVGQLSRSLRPTRTTYTDKLPFTFVGGAGLKTKTSPNVKKKEEPKTPMGTEKTQSVVNKAKKGSDKKQAAAPSSLPTQLPIYQPRPSLNDYPKLRQDNSIPRGPKIYCPNILAGHKVHVTFNVFTNDNSGRTFLVPFFNIGGSRTQFDVEDTRYICRSMAGFEREERTCARHLMYYSKENGKAIFLRKERAQVAEVSEKSYNKICFDIEGYSRQPQKKKIIEVDQEQWEVDKSVSIEIDKADDEGYEESSWDAERRKENGASLNIGDKLRTGTSARTRPLFTEATVLKNKGLSLQTVQMKDESLPTINGICSVVNSEHDETLDVSVGSFSNQSVLDKLRKHAEMNSDTDSASDEVVDEATEKEPAYTEQLKQLLIGEIKGSADITWSPPTSDDQQHIAGKDGSEDIDPTFLIPEIKQEKLDDGYELSTVAVSSQAQTPTSTSLSDPVCENVQPASYTTSSDFSNVFIKPEPLDDYSEAMNGSIPPLNDIEIPAITAHAAVKQSSAAMETQQNTDLTKTWPDQSLSEVTQPDDKGMKILSTETSDIIKTSKLLDDQCSHRTTADSESDMSERATSAHSEVKDTEVCLQSGESHELQTLSSNEVDAAALPHEHTSDISNKDEAHVKDGSNNEEERSTAENSDNREDDMDESDLSSHYSGIHKTTHSSSSCSEDSSSDEDELDLLGSLPAAPLAPGDQSGAPQSKITSLVESLRQRLSQNTPKTLPSWLTPVETHAPTEKKKKKKSTNLKEMNNESECSEIVSKVVETSQTSSIKSPTSQYIPVTCSMSSDTATMTTESSVSSETEKSDNKTEATTVNIPIKGDFSQTIISSPTTSVESFIKSSIISSDSDISQHSNCNQPSVTIANQTVTESLSTGSILVNFSSNIVTTSTQALTKSLMSVSSTSIKENTKLTPTSVATVRHSKSEQEKTELGKDLQSNSHSKVCLPRPLSHSESETMLLPIIPSKSMRNINTDIRSQAKSADPTVISSPSNTDDVKTNNLVESSAQSDPDHGAISFGTKFASVINTVIKQEPTDCDEEVESQAILPSIDIVKSLVDTAASCQQTNQMDNCTESAEQQSTNDLDCHFQTTSGRSSPESEIDIGTDDLPETLMTFSPIHPLVCDTPIEPLTKGSKNKGQKRSQRARSSSKSSLYSKSANIWMPVSPIEPEPRQQSDSSGSVASYLSKKFSVDFESNPSKIKGPRLLQRRPKPQPEASAVNQTHSIVTTTPTPTTSVHTSVDSVSKAPSLKEIFGIETDVPAVPSPPKKHRPSAPKVNTSGLLAEEKPSSNISATPPPSGVMTTSPLSAFKVTTRGAEPAEAQSIPEPGDHAVTQIKTEAYIQVAKKRTGGNSTMAHGSSQPRLTWRQMSKLAREARSKELNNASTLELATTQDQTASSSKTNVFFQKRSCYISLERLEFMKFDFIGDLKNGTVQLVKPVEIKKEPVDPDETSQESVQTSQESVKVKARKVGLKRRKKKPMKAPKRQGPRPQKDIVDYLASMLESLQKKAQLLEEESKKKEMEELAKKEKEEKERREAEANMSKESLEEVTQAKDLAAKESTLTADPAKETETDPPEHEDNYEKTESQEDDSAELLADKKETDLHTSGLSKNDTTTAEAHEIPSEERKEVPTSEHDTSLSEDPSLSENISKPNQKDDNMTAGTLTTLTHELVPAEQSASSALPEMTDVKILKRFGKKDIMLNPELSEISVGLENDELPVERLDDDEEDLEGDDMGVIPQEEVEMLLGLEAEKINDLPVDSSTPAYQLSKESIEHESGIESISKETGSPLEDVQESIADREKMNESQSIGSDVGSGDIKASGSISHVSEVIVASSHPTVNEIPPLDSKLGEAHLLSEATELIGKGGHNLLEGAEALMTTDLGFSPASSPSHSLVIALDDQEDTETKMDDDFGPISDFVNDIVERDRMEISPTNITHQENTTESRETDFNKEMSNKVATLEQIQEPLKESNEISLEISSPEHTPSDTSTQMSPKPTRSKQIMERSPSWRRLLGSPALKEMERQLNTASSQSSAETQSQGELSNLRFKLKLPTGALSKAIKMSRELQTVFGDAAQDETMEPESTCLSKDTIIESQNVPTPLNDDGNTLVCGEEQTKIDAEPPKRKTALAQIKFSSATLSAIQRVKAELSKNKLEKLEVKKSSEGSDSEANHSTQFQQDLDFYFKNAGTNKTSFETGIPPVAQSSVQPAIPISDSNPDGQKEASSDTAAGKVSKSRKSVGAPHDRVVRRRTRQCSTTTKDNADKETSSSDQTDSPADALARESLSQVREEPSQEDTDLSVLSKMQKFISSMTPQEPQQGERTELTEAQPKKPLQGLGAKNPKPIDLTKLKLKLNPLVSGTLKNNLKLSNEAKDTQKNVEQNSEQAAVSHPPENSQSNDSLSMVSGLMQSLKQSLKSLPSADETKQASVSETASQLTQESTMSTKTDNSSIKPVPVLNSLKLSNLLKGLKKTVDAHTPKNNAGKSKTGKVDKTADSSVSKTNDIDVPQRRKTRSDNLRTIHGSGDDKVISKIKKASVGKPESDSVDEGRKNSVQRNDSESKTERSFFDCLTDVPTDSWHG